MRVHYVYIIVSKTIKQSTNKGAEMNYKTVCNGITNYLNATDLESAMAEADNAASYCQENITLIETDDEGKEITEYIRKWWNVPFDKKEDESLNPIEFGDFGYYSDWEQVG